MRREIGDGVARCERQKKEFLNSRAEKIISQKKKGVEKEKGEKLFRLKNRSEIDVLSKEERREQGGVSLHSRGNVERRSRSLEASQRSEQSEG